MKRFLFVIVVVFLLLFFSSCNRRPSLEEEYETLSDEYFRLEEKYYDVSDYLEKTESALCDLNDYYIVAWSYYDDSDPDITEEKAHEAFLKIGDILHELGY